MKRILYVFTVLVVSVMAAKGQEKKDKSQLVQFSGVVVTADSLYPVPYTSIMIKNSNRGTVSDYYGFFSFVAKMKDTLEFSAIGFKKSIIVIPDTLSDQRCSMIQVLTKDTLFLKEVVIFPWPTKEQFKEAFIKLRVPDDDMARAEKNLDREQLNFLAANLAMDGSMNFRNYMDQRATKLYYAGQTPTTQLLNPLAWAKFIEMWQNGSFKKKDTKKTFKTGDE